MDEKKIDKKNDNEQRNQTKITSGRIQNMEYGDERCKKKLIFVGFYVVRFNCLERIKCNGDRKRFMYNDNITKNHLS